MSALHCSRCQYELQFPVGFEGRTPRCPVCGEALRIPVQDPHAGTGAQVSTPPIHSEVGEPLLSGPPTRVLKAVTPVPSPPTPDPQRYDFLAPPQLPDELGRLGPYRVLNLLGGGGMGVVFRAEDPGLQRVVALKVMNPLTAASSTARQRFLREARTAATLEHDHIVRIYQVGEDRGVPYLAMEFLRGRSLEERLKSGEQMPAGEILRIGREMAEGLACAHAAGLIHRDIKPANVWLEGTRGRVKLLDFGLARGSDDVQLTALGAVVGTPAYMAPEQARGEEVDHRCDLFSLGSVLYRVATRRLPFKGKDTVSTLLSLTVDVPTAPEAVCPEVPAGLSRLIMALLNKNREDRPSTANAVVEMIRAMEAERAPTSNTSIVAQPPAPRAPAPKPAPSSWGLWVLGVACGLLLGAVGAAGLLSGWPRAADEPRPEDAAARVPKPPQPPPPGGSPPAADPDADWRRGVLALPVELRPAAVAARFRERNPGFDDPLNRFVVRDGAVVDLAVAIDAVADLAPLRALRDLENLRLESARPSRVADLSPLRGMPLKSLALWRTQVRDLSPLAGMALTVLTCQDCLVHDLTPLTGMPLTRLELLGTDVHDLTPLTGMPLDQFKAGPNPRLNDISPLKGMPLKELVLIRVNVSDLSPLRGMSLRSLEIQGTRVADLGPLTGMPLEYVSCEDSAVEDVTPVLSPALQRLNFTVRSAAQVRQVEKLTTLEWVNGQRREDFARHALAELAYAAWWRTAEGLPADRQVSSAVAGAAAATAGDSSLRLRFARFLIEREKFREARAALAPALAAHPDRLELVREDGECLAKQGEWRAAAGQHEKLVAARWPDWRLHVLTACLLRLRAGDRDGYLDGCRQILRDSDGSAEPYAQVYAALCAGVRADGPDPGKVLAMMERLPRALDAGAMYWNPRALGLAQYRAGRYADAVRTLSPLCDTTATGFDYVLPALPLAMSLHHLGRGAEAKDHLDRARRVYDAEAAAHPASAIVPLPGAWHWPENLLVPPRVDEAGAVISGKR